MLANAKKIQRRSQKAREEAASNKLEHNEDDESDDDNVKGIEFFYLSNCPFSAFSQKFSAKIFTVGRY